LSRLVRCASAPAPVSNKSHSAEVISTCTNLARQRASRPKTDAELGRHETMASMESLGELLQEELKDIYDAEKQLTKALPKLAKKASASELQEAFEDHLRQTEQHVERLEQVFDQL